MIVRNINSFNILRWYRMLTGQSIYHVKQGVGRVYDKDHIAGYYNDLTLKVLKDADADDDYLPLLDLPSGEQVKFPIAIFQYGLGAYDLYIIHNEKKYLRWFRHAADWAMSNQASNGSWNTFYYIFPESPYSAMAQGEGASLLMRAYKEYDDLNYLKVAGKAIEFMLRPVSEGGTTYYNGHDIYFQEYSHKPTVLNGWIFAMFGLYDFLKSTKDKRMEFILQASLRSLESSLSKFDSGFWSYYNIDRSILASPFYHDLHIAQLSALEDIFQREELRKYIIRWKNYQNRWSNNSLAFILKAWQKVSIK